MKTSVKISPGGAGVKATRVGGSRTGKAAQGDRTKVALAEELRKETTVTVKWLAKRLRMGAAGYVHLLLYCSRKSKYDEIKTPLGIYALRELQWKGGIGALVCSATTASTDDRNYYARLL